MNKLSETHHPKIAVIHPRLVVGGGSESKALWMLETLKDDYEVFLITMGKIDLNQLNECYGTNLKPDEFKIISIPIPYLLRKRFDALRGYRLARFCKQHASEFDLMISTYNTMDFGKRGIQCIADFSFDDRLRRAFHPSLKGLNSLFYRASPARSIYLKLANILAGDSKDGWKRNLTIVNSEWTGKIIKEAYGMDSRLIYPPVASEFPIIPWNRKENGFVCIGRLVPEKKIDRHIKILGEARKKGWDIHLHIIGESGNLEYINELRGLCKRNSDWVFMEGGIFGRRKLEFIAQHKFGINGCEKEAFGIGVAEMIKAGCIVWVPNGGGQVEIVKHPTLIYNDVDDAVNKIEQVLKSNTTQIELREHLTMQSQKFSTERFTTEMRDVVQQFLKEK